MTLFFGLGCLRCAVCALYWPFPGASWSRSWRRQFKTFPGVVCLSNQCKVLGHPAKSELKVSLSWLLDPCKCSRRWQGLQSAVCVHASSCARCASLTIWGSSDGAVLASDWSGQRIMASYWPSLNITILWALCFDQKLASRWMLKSWSMTPPPCFAKNQVQDKHSFGTENTQCWCWRSSKLSKWHLLWSFLCHQLVLRWPVWCCNEFFR